MEMGLKRKKKANKYLVQLTLSRTCGKWSVANESKRSCARGCSVKSSNALLTVNWKMGHRMFYNKYQTWWAFPPHESEVTSVAVIVLLPSTTSVALTQWAMRKVKKFFAVNWPPHSDFLIHLDFHRTESTASSQLVWMHLKSSSWPIHMAYYSMRSPLRPSTKSTCKEPLLTKEQRTLASTILNSWCIRLFTQLDPICVALLVLDIAQLSRFPRLKLVYCLWQKMLPC